MTKIIFITSGKIEYELPGFSLYESIRRTACGRKFPSLVEGADKEIGKVAKQIKKLKPAVIYSAPSRQAKETALIFSKIVGKPLVTEKKLLPLRFDLSLIMDEKEFRKLGKRKFDVLRKRFLKAFYEDRLIDKNVEVATRFNRFVKDVVEKYPSETVVVVSHAYLIKLFSIYYRIGDEIFSKKKKLFNLFDPSRSPMERLEMVEIDLEK